MMTNITNLWLLSIVLREDRKASLFQNTATVAIKVDTKTNPAAENTLIKFLKTKLFRTLKYISDH